MTTGIITRVPTRFGPDTRFEITPIPTAPFLAALENRFEGLRNRLLLERLKQVADPRFNNQIRRAANEAAALAWVTPYPLLFFPGLFEERAQAAIARSAGALLSQPEQELAPV
jgi:hypothetical protein